MAQKPCGRATRSARACLPLAAALLLIASCGNNPTTRPAATAPAPTATWLTTAGPAAPPPLPPPGVPTSEASGALPGTHTCADLNTAITQATLMEPGVIDRVVAAASTADAPVSDAAQRLATAYAKATSSKGTPQEPDAVAAVSAAAADMAGVCAESGLESAG